MFAPPAEDAACYDASLSVPVASGATGPNGDAFEADLDFASFGRDSCPFYRFVKSS
eukprot:m.77128 g.77128  ORF g.77128 m.77128 type:complete len:56 (+) comp50485_c0_seq2:472-639(+)